MDISKFFDTIDRELLMKAVRKHTNCTWILLYIQRWLTVSYEKSEGTRIERDKGVPQGSAMRMTAFVAAIVYHRRKDKLLWQVLSVNVKTYLRKVEFSFSLLGKKKIQKVQIQIDPFIS